MNQKIKDAAYELLLDLLYLPGRMTGRDAIAVVLGVFVLWHAYNVVQLFSLNDVIVEEGPVEEVSNFETTEMVEVPVMGVSDRDVEPDAPHVNPAMLLPSNGRVVESVVALIRQAEGFEPKAYKCPAGVWTVGYGTTTNRALDIKVTPRSKVTVERAEELLQRGLNDQYGPEVTRLVRVPLTRGQYSALVSLVYNIGPAAFKRSSLRRVLNRGDYEGAAQQFDRWVYAGGRRLRGLVKRRAAEKEVFLSGTL